MPQNQMLLEGLNEAQRAAVSAPSGAVLVLAGPGSGKTRVLTQRVAYLIEHERVPPWKIMAVTFTNKAAKEMRERVVALLEEHPRGLTMGTFHATCVRILRREAEHLTQYQNDFVIFDTADQLQVVKQALKDLNLDDKKFAPGKLLNGISKAKNELITPELYAANNYISEVTRRVYQQYQDLLFANNAMDFDDLLMNTVLLFQESSAVLARYQERYEHILVDEFQDTNTSQYRLVGMLAAGHSNIFVVGDSDQSIYKWRGADFRNLSRFRDDYPHARQYLLEQNYRSTQIILDAAKSVIVNNPHRVHKELFTTREDGLPIYVREAYNEQEEAELIVQTMEVLRREGYAGGDFAVMYRINAQSRVLEETFLRAGLPYLVVGATEFYKRREIKDIIAYLRLIYNTSDAISFGRVLNVPTRGIGAKTRQSLLDWAQGRGQQPAEALRMLTSDAEAQYPFRGRAYRALSAFGELLNEWVAARDRLAVGDLLDLVLAQINYRQYVDDGTNEGADRWQNVLELHSAAAENPDMPLGDFLEQIALVSETDDLEDRSARATLLTLHAAKGLEFPVVFITGLEEGLLPHSRSFDDGEELAEERRLFYVGLTRARDRVFLSHAFRRTVYGDSSPSTPSRFLADIPESLTEGNSFSARRQQTVKRASQWSRATTWDTSSPTTSSMSNTRIDVNESDRWSDHKPLPAPRHLGQAGTSQGVTANAGQKSQYHSGQRVRHAKFGEGTVIESKLTGDDEEVTVAFPDLGIKRLAASFAKLELID